MTTVVIRRRADGEYAGFYCMGHAQYAGEGETDELCAGISVLVLNTVNVLTELAGEQVTTVTDEETGFIRCDFVSPLQERSSFAVDAMVYGLQTLSQNYGEKYLAVKFEEV